MNLLLFLYLTTLSWALTPSEESKCINDRFDIEQIDVFQVEEGLESAVAHANLDDIDAITARDVSKGLSKRVKFSHRLLKKLSRKQSKGRFSEKTNKKMIL
jgi:hypothetical protein